MKTPRSFDVFMLLVACLLLVAGCASPEYRIKKNPDMFASFPPEVQELVRKGEIALGFTPDMVSMALGAPNRIYNRQSTTGSVDVWSYTSTRTSTDRQRVQTDIRYRDDRGRYRTATDWVWVDVARDTEYERLRVEFVEGKVTAIDTLKQP